MWIVRSRRLRSGWWSVGTRRLDFFWCVCRERERKRERDERQEGEKDQPVPLKRGGGISKFVNGPVYSCFRWHLCIELFEKREMDFVYVCVC